MRARIDSEWPGAADGADDGPDGPVSIGGWLVKGAPRPGPDPRRKQGRHGGARRLLAGADAVPADHGTWRDLVSALRRHTVHSELAQLAREDRHILSLAYVHGHSNREIASMLNVSVRTVSRRLAAALARLEESARRAGAWVSILGLAMLAWSARAGSGSRTTRTAAAALAAACTATAVGVAFGVATPGLSALPAVAPPVLARTMPDVLPLVRGGGVVPAEPADVAVHVQSLLAPAPSTGARPATTLAAVQGCGGNPTSAPPAVPIGRRSGHPPAQPVTHPGPGGCGP